MFQGTVTHEVRRLRSRTLLLFAALIMALHLLDFFILGRPSLDLLGIRFLWASFMAATALVVGRLRPLQAQLLSGSYGVVSSLCFLGLVVFTGDTQSPYFPFFPTLPLVLAMLSNEFMLAAFMCGIVSALGGGGLLLEAGAPISQAVMWAVITVCMMFFGMYGGAQVQKAQKAEGQFLLERSRREALEKLAVSEHRRAQAEKLATIGRLAAAVVHEINTPIAYVQSNLRFLQREVLAQPSTSQENIREALQDMATGMERIEQIVSDIRGFSRMDAEGPTQCSLADVVRDAVRLASMRLKYVARLKVEIPAELPEVYVVRRRLAQVIINLLVNAGDALESRRRLGGEIRLLGLVEGATVVLSIEDNGPGFPPEVLSRLFEAFLTTKDPEKGTGLGLMLSREYVEQFGGTLTAENRKEGGARLRLTLPVREARVAAAS